MLVKFAYSVIGLLVMIIISTADECKQLSPLATSSLNRKGGRIVNGQLAGPKQFPYQAGLDIITKKKERLWCGGVLISNSWVLTVAHCAIHIHEVLIYLGYSDLKKGKIGLQRRICAPKSNVFIHKEFDHSHFFNDISAIKLPEEIEFNDYIQPISLPPTGLSHSYYDGKIALASGWGRTEQNKLSRKLLYIAVPVMNNTRCALEYIHSSFIQQTHICISTTDKRSTCSGDSGGPLAYTDGSINYLIGILSFGAYDDCEAGFPEIFTRITSYLSWIEDITGVVNS